MKEIKILFGFIVCLPIYILIDVWFYIVDKYCFVKNHVK